MRVGFLKINPVNPVILSEIEGFRCEKGDLRSGQARRYFSTVIHIGLAQASAP